MWSMQWHTSNQTAHTRLGQNTWKEWSRDFLKLMKSVNFSMMNAEGSKRSTVVADAVIVSLYKIWPEQTRVTYRLLKLICSKSRITQTFQHQTTNSACRSHRQVAKHRWKQSSSNINDLTSREGQEADTGQDSTVLVYSSCKLSTIRRCSNVL